MNEPATNSLPTTPSPPSATLAYVAFGLSLFAPLLVLLKIPTHQLPQPLSSVISWIAILSVPGAFTLSILSLSLGKGKARKGKARKGKARKGRGFAIAALVISIVTVAVIVLALIALATVLSGAIAGGLGLLALILGAH